MPNANVVKQLMTDLEMIRETDTDHLVSSADSGSAKDADFSVLVPYLRVVQEMTASITPEVLAEVSDDLINRFRNPLSEFASGITAAAQFKAGSYGNPAQESLNLRRKVQNNFENLAQPMRIVGDLATATVPISERPELVKLRAVIEELEGTARKTAVDHLNDVERGLSLKNAVEERSAELNQLVETARKDLEAISKEQRDQVSELIGSLEVEINERLGATRKAVAEIAVSQQANHFDIEAKRHFMAAWLWLGCTVVSVIIFLVVAVPGFFEAVVSWTSPSTFDALVSPSAAAHNVLGVPLPYLLSKLVTLGALSFLIGICAKNFLSHRHNNVLNRHRTNALMTFEALAKSAVSESSRDVILHHAASCIFNPQDTGFGKVGEAGPGINIVEAVRHVADPLKPSSS